MKDKRSAICRHCGKSVRIGVPRGGDGSIDVYYRHKDKSGKPCDGARREVK